MAQRVLGLGLRVLQGLLLFRGSRALCCVEGLWGCGARGSRATVGDFEVFGRRERQREVCKLQDTLNGPEP